MATGLLIVDVCNADDDKALRKLVANSIDFWVAKQKYALISDDKGPPDIISVHTSSGIKDGQYKPGPGVSTFGQVILVFQKVE